MLKLKTIILMNFFLNSATGDSEKKDYQSWMYNLIINWNLPGTALLLPFIPIQAPRRRL